MQFKAYNIKFHFINFCYQYDSPAFAWICCIQEQFFEILRYDPDLVLSGLSSKQPVDLNHIMADVSVKLERGSLTLSLSTPTLSTVDTAGESLPFLELTFNTLDVVLILLGDGSHTRTTITLADLNVYEAYEADTKAAITGGKSFLTYLLSSCS